MLTVPRLVPLAATLNCVTYTDATPVRFQVSVPLAVLEAATLTVAGRKTGTQLVNN